MCQLSNVLQYVHKLIRETQRYLIIPLFRKSPLTIYKIFIPKSKKKQNFHKPPENCIYCMQNKSFFSIVDEACIIEYTIIMHYVTFLTREENSSERDQLNTRISPMAAVLEIASLWCITGHTNVVKP